MPESDAEYAALWLSELGAYVPEYRPDRVPLNGFDLPRVRPRHDRRDARGRFAPDPTRPEGRA
jgi:hypothetical protein